jgi:hypothetical protein
VARHEISVNNVQVARQEIDAVEKAIRTVERFIPEIPEEQRKPFEEKLTELKAAFGSLGNDLKR